MSTGAADADGFTDHRFARIRGAYERLRARHPRELAGPLTWNGAQSILRRERIRVVRLPMLRPAALIHGGGVRVMLLDTSAPGRRHLPCIAHELAHVELDCREEDSALPVYHMQPAWPDGDREDDAEVLAMILLGGPRFVRTF
jgi:hypothetical protein